MNTVRSAQLHDITRDARQLGRILVPTYSSLDVQDLVPGEVFGIETDTSCVIELVVLAFSTPGQGGQEMKRFYLNFNSVENHYDDEGMLESVTYLPTGTERMLFGGIFMVGQSMDIHWHDFYLERDIGKITAIYQVSSAYPFDQGHSWPHE